MKKLIFSFLLAAVIIIAFVLRFYRVTSDPPSLNWDEVSIGYNAYSILKTGKDEWGEFLPLHFKSYGEYKLPAQIYASIPAIAIFGLNNFGVRITPVVYGTLTVLFLYFLTLALFKNRYISLISSLLLAVSPWHIQLTRASFESSFSVMWVVLGVWFLLKGFKKPIWWVFSAIPFAISVYTYNSARVFTPLFLFAIFFIFRKDFLRFKKEALLAGFILFVFMIPLIPFITSGEARARYRLVSITDDPGLIPRINERRGLSKLPKPIPRLIHNKVTYVGYYFSKNYLAHFTPNFLFVSGAGHRQHHVQGLGELYVIQAPFLIFGLFFLFKNKAPLANASGIFSVRFAGAKSAEAENSSHSFLRPRSGFSAKADKNKFRWFVVSWLLLTFVPVSTTNDSIPNALRTLIAAPAYQILTAIGFVELVNIIKDRKNLFRLVIPVSFIILSVEVVRYLYIYHTIYPKRYSRDWQYGYKEVVEFIKDRYNNYDEIVFTRHYGEPHMFTLFYLNWDPAKFQSDKSLIRFETYNWVRVLRFDKFYFPDLGDKGTQYSDIVNENPDKKILFVGKPGDFSTQTPKLFKVDFLNEDTAFEIVEYM